MLGLKLNHVSKSGHWYQIPGLLKWGSLVGLFQVTKHYSKAASNMATREMDTFYIYRILIIAKWRN